MLRAPDSTTFTASIEIADEQGMPVIPRPGYPKVTLLDSDKSPIATFTAVPGQAQGIWTSAISLPMLGVTRPTEYKIRWRCLGEDGERYQLFDTVLIDPKAERRDSEIVVVAGSPHAEFVIPLMYDAVMDGRYQAYSNNTALLPDWVAFSSSAVAVDAGVDRTLISIPLLDVPPSLFANLLSIHMRVRGRPKVFSYKYWHITPQIALAMTVLEDFLNKSRIENVIPELEYTDGDLVGYLEKGLHYFNSVGVQTSFNGLNMQGPLMDSWQLCTAYWAISTQLLAEGSLAFDFSGQGISLNVDRTPQLDAALSRIEARIQDTVIPLKKLLGQQGITKGDGSVGASDMRNPYNMGTLQLINAPTTRVSGWSNYIGLRSRS